MKPQQNQIANKNNNNLMIKQKKIQMKIQKKKNIDNKSKYPINKRIIKNKLLKIFII